MANGVLIPQAIMATNIDAYNRSVQEASDVQQGSVLVMSLTKSSTFGEDEVWEVSQPATGAGLTNLWMAYSGDEVVLSASKYKGLDPDPRNFLNTANTVFSAHKVALGDLYLMSEDAVAGTKSTNTFVVATNAAYKLTWAAAAVSGVSFKLIGTSYISIGSGAIDTQRVTAYQFECVALA